MTAEENAQSILDAVNKIHDEDEKKAKRAKKKIGGDHG